MQRCHRSTCVSKGLRSSAGAGREQARGAYAFKKRQVRYGTLTCTSSIARAHRLHVLGAVRDETSNIELIEGCLQSLYGQATSERVMKSLELTLSGREVVRYIATKGEQRASSYIDGLSAIPYHDVHNGQFTWLEKLEHESERIKCELNLALANPELSSMGNSIWAPAARDDAVAYGPNWRTLVLQDRCQWEEVNCRLFPITTEILKAANCPSVEVFFARQPPNTGIKPHTDNTNFILTAHLGIDVPEQLAWMQVGEFKKYWANGEGLVADTSFIHSTANESNDKDRYVLIVRFWHPELRDVERQALQFLFEALDNPSSHGIHAAAERARQRLPTKMSRRKRRSSTHEGLGLLSKGMR